jgi:hypothetical protein
MRLGGSHLLSFVGSKCSMPPASTVLYKGNSIIQEVPPSALYMHVVYFHMGRDDVRHMMTAKPITS